MKVCGNCKFRNAPDRDSCVKCGASFRAAAKSGGKMFAAIGSALLAVIVIGLFVFRFVMPSRMELKQERSLYENRVRAETEASRKAGPAPRASVPVTKKGNPARPVEPPPPPAKRDELPKSQFDSILKEAAGHYAEEEYRRAFNLYLAAEGFRKLPEDALKKKEGAWAMLTLKEVTDKLEIQSEFNVDWARMTRSRLRSLDYNAFPSEAHRKKYLETLKRLEKIAAGGRRR